MDTAKPKGGKWQATLKIEEGSSKLTVKMPFNKSSSSEGAELKDVPKAQKQKGNKNVNDNKKKNNKCKNEQDPEDAQSASQQVNKKQKVVPQESNASKPEKKSKFTEESNAHPKPSKVTKGQVTAESKQTKPKGYQMPLSLGECIVDAWFTRHHDNSFSHFLKTLNETEASVGHEMLVGKGNLSGSSGQFSDVTESSGNLVQADGCLEKSCSKVENKDSGSKTEKTEPNKNDIESQKPKTPERKIIKEQKSQNKSVKTPDSKKKKKNNDSPMRLKNKSLKKKLFDNDENADSSDENNVVSEIISKLEESPVENKKKYRKSTPKKVKQGEPIAVTPCKSPHIKPQSANVPPESVLPDIDWEKVLGSEGNKDFYTTVMFNGKPLKVFVTTEEVKIKKEKVEKVELPIAQSSEKEESDK